MDPVQLRREQEQFRREYRRWLLWAGAAVGLSVGLFFTIAILIGYRYGITLWDWIQLLIVPAVIAGGGFWFNTQQRQREQRIADARAQDDTLQGYLDGMSQLLTDKEQPLHQAQPGDNLSTVARARTLTALSRLGWSRKKSVLQFLYESGLIYKGQTLLDESDLIERRHNIVGLQQADLREADLRWANLSGADLREANLEEADLREADLSVADLSVADPSGANLRGATGVTNEELWLSALTLRGATMPNGQKYEDWLESKSNGEK